MGEKNELTEIKKEANSFRKDFVNGFFWLVNLGVFLVVFIELARLRYFNVHDGIFETLIALAIAIISFVGLNYLRKKVVGSI